jgi:ABC-type nickel/cobalt efflux system permease component RcnA
MPVITGILLVITTILLVITTILLVITTTFPVITTILPVITTILFAFAVLGNSLQKRIHVSNGAAWRKDAHTEHLLQEHQESTACSRSFRPSNGRLEEWGGSTVLWRIITPGHPVPPFLLTLCILLLAPELELLLLGFLFPLAISVLLILPPIGIIQVFVVLALGYLEILRIVAIEKRAEYRG